MFFKSIFSSIITTCVITFIVSSCSSNQDGPCEWNIAEFSALVTEYEFEKINQAGDSVFIVWVDFSSGSLNNELQDLGKLRNVEFTREKIRKNQAFKGNSYTGLINDLKEGNCESPIISFNQKLR
ncbi:MAG: hypothetical protein ACPGEG_07205 [Salibacteraceae bacterium]